MKGKCIIFSAPSGSGKSTIVHWLMQEHPELRLAFSVSAASRQPRPGEQ
ncbi:MAG: guanylate kinase, partial [Bacteroidaceae bacterium]|nr:guanylate kinase [Bacteroidaceae bacterium]